MKYLLVPVIMVCVIGGTVGALKLIQNFFPESGNTVEKTQEWIDKHQTTATKNKQDSE